METNDTVQLKDENIYPDDSVLKQVLGQSFDAYRDLLELFSQNEITHEWRYYRDGKAWLCKVQKKKKTIVWMSAWNGYIKATIYFPERYLEELLALKISELMKEKIRSVKRVGKSVPCIFEVRDKAVLMDFNEVMQFKKSLK